MEEQAYIYELWDVMRRRKVQIIIPASLVFLLSVIIIFMLPPVYKSSATILIEAQEIPQDFVRTTVTGYVEERLQMITHLVLSRARLQELITRFGLYENLKDKRGTEAIIEKMRRDIRMEPIQAAVVNPQSGKPGSATIAFRLSYEGRDPEKVAEVANVLTSLYLEENLKSREERARTTFEFLEDQLGELRSEIVRLEAEIAAFKNKHISELPELMQLNLQTMERLEREIDAKEEQIKTLTNRRVYLEGQLATVEPLMYTVSADGKRILTAQEELEALRSRYLSLGATLSEEHPDVIALKKRLDAMESEVATREDLRERYRELRHKETELAMAAQEFSPKHPDVVRLEKEVALLKADVEAISEKQTALKAEDQKPENPSYINLQTQIASTQMDIDNAEKELKLLTEKYEDYQRRVENTPQVEQEYRALQRDYANAEAKYQETMDRLLGAREAKGLEESRMAERFTLVDSPIIPERPHKPNRLIIFVVGVVMAIGCGTGVAGMAEYMDKSVRRADELAKISGHSVLAVIPHWGTPRDRAGKRRSGWDYVTGTGKITVEAFAPVGHFLGKHLKGESMSPPVDGEEETGNKKSLGTSLRGFFRKAFSRVWRTRR